ncbi:hypothetical protein [Longispora urticae]
MRDSGKAWTSPPWTGWTDLANLRAKLAAGADPEWIEYYRDRPLRMAAEYGTPDVVAELAGRVVDVDASDEDRSALWAAVHAGRHDNALALVAAGADPWRTVVAGWSPGRLNLAGARPDLFGPAPDGQRLTPAEVAAAAESLRLRPALAAAARWEGSVACVAGIDAAECAHRLGASPLEPALAGALDEAADGQGWFSVFDNLDASLPVLGVADVPGGCVVVQPWAYTAALPEVVEPLSRGTVVYGLNVGPGDGAVGSVSRDGEMVAGDLAPGCDGWGDEMTTGEVLLGYLYRDDHVGHSYAYAGLRPVDAGPLLGRTDRWVRLRS